MTDRTPAITKAHDMEETAYLLGMARRTLQQLLDANLIRPSYDSNPLGQYRKWQFTDERIAEIRVWLSEKEKAVGQLTRKVA